jgi:hypothetical protein
MYVCCVWGRKGAWCVHLRDLVPKPHWLWCHYRRRLSFHMCWVASVSLINVVSGFHCLQRFSFLSCAEPFPVFQSDSAFRNQGDNATWVRTCASPADLPRTRLSASAWCVSLIGGPFTGHGSFVTGFQTPLDTVPYIHIFFIFLYFISWFLSSVTKQQLYFIQLVWIISNLCISPMLWQCLITSTLCFADLILMYFK